jgi:hypothetical protein
MVQVATRYSEYSKYFPETLNSWAQSVDTSVKRLGYSRYL